MIIYIFQYTNDDTDASDEDTVEYIKEPLYELTYSIIDAGTAQ